MKILIVNDDSITAPGIEKLANAASCLGEVWVVAPEAQCSALSQKLTLREQLTVRKIEDFPVKAAGAYAVGGTPVDCVKVALTYILKEKPDYVFSGINNGYNAGFDIAYSGTLGAAFEGARSGIPSLAFSTAGDAHLDEYTDASTERGQCMLKRICEKLGFASLGYQSLDGLLEAIGLPREKVCTYCWNGKE